jgi:hypothetical protein
MALKKGDHSNVVRYARRKKPRDALGQRKVAGDGMIGRFDDKKQGDPRGSRGCS